MKQDGWMDVIEEECLHRFLYILKVILNKTIGILRNFTLTSILKSNQNIQRIILCSNGVRHIINIILKEKLILIWGRSAQCYLSFQILIFPFNVCFWGQLMLCLLQYGMLLCFNLIVTSIIVDTMWCCIFPGSIHDFHAAQLVQPISTLPRQSVAISLIRWPLVFVARLQDLQ